MVRLEADLCHIRSFETAFQFHDGTIRRERVRVPFSAKKHHFNSTMVRLEGKQPDSKAKESLHFNSTMVRLEVSNRQPKEEVRNLFQFHDGTIRSWREMTEVVKTKISIPRWYD